jgi:AbrB family looped-hinge helix DNA binding protein
MGRLVIPVDLRHIMEIKPGDKMEFFYDAEQKAIFIRKYIGKIEDGSK